MKKSGFANKLDKAICYKKSKELREYLQKHKEFIKSLGIKRANTKTIEIVSKIECKADLLDGESGFEQIDIVKKREDKQLDEIEKAISTRELTKAVELFNIFLQNAYDGCDNHSKSSPQCTKLWLLRHYVDMNSGTTYTRSDILAQRLLDIVEDYYTGGRCNTKKAYSVTKEERDELGFSFRQLSRLNTIFADLQQNLDISKDKFLDNIEEFVAEKIFQVQCNKCLVARAC